ncbi:MAG: hypothetical protein AB1Y26_07705 [Cycloclasticus sp.]
MNSKNWLEVLADACAETSQSRVSMRLKQPDGFPSPTVINQVLKDKYPGRKDRLKALVEGVYMNRTVICPVSDEISSDVCEENQSRPFINTNPIRVRLFKACRGGCPHSRLEKDHA